MDDLTGVDKRALDRIEELGRTLEEVRLMVEDHMHLDHVDDALEIIDKALEERT
jgi:glyoxylase-like metal-dependent hydrolase (beta-lactamase superfamily II)